VQDSARFSVYLPVNTTPKREKPHRLNRDDYRGMIRCAFTICSIDRKPRFAPPRMRHLLLEILPRMSRNYACAVTIYVFMPDHIHLILKGETPAADLYAFVVEMKKALTNRVGSRQCEPDFHDHIIRDKRDLAHEIMYVLLNPVRARLVDQWWQYDGTGSLCGSLDEIVRFAQDVMFSAERDGKRW